MSSEDNILIPHAQHKPVTKWVPSYACYPTIRGEEPDNMSERLYGEELQGDQESTLCDIIPDGLIVTCYGLTNLR